MHFDLQAKGLLFNDDADSETSDDDAVDEIDVLGERQPDGDDEDRSDAGASGEVASTQHDTTTARAETEETAEDAAPDPVSLVPVPTMLSRLAASRIVYSLERVIWRQQPAVDWRSNEKHNTSTTQRPTEASAQSSNLNVCVAVYHVQIQLGRPETEFGILVEHWIGSCLHYRRWRWIGDGEKEEHIR